MHGSEFCFERPGRGRRLAIGRARRSYIEFPCLICRRTSRRRQQTILPKVVAPPTGAKPRVPQGFDVALFASGFANPRYLLTAPNGDIFVTESSAGSIRVLRDSDGDGHPEINKRFATGLRQPFGLAFYPAGQDPAISVCCQYGQHRAFPVPQWRSPGTGQGGAYR